MAEGKKSVLLYCDLLFTVEKMDDETAGKFFKHYLNYINDNDPITDNLVVDIAFESVKQNLKRDLKKWEKRAEASRSNGSKGGRPKKPKKPTGLIENLDEPRKPVTDTVTVTVTDTVSKVDSTTVGTVDFDNLLKYINKTFGREFRKINNSVKDKYKARIKEGYTTDDIRSSINGCKKDAYHIETNFKYCTPDYFSRAKTIDLHSSVGTPEESSDPLVNYAKKQMKLYGNS